ncbi:beta-galactosidase [Demequina sp. NBRC 110057]|uniref:beta-galactosidase n=1 Tax=Demequina sp. NBRC 110057 TaxID=1570346 RepID=UPI000A029795|nr:beta-galactosidase [Demequina sp. NBRC 110057]
MATDASRPATMPAHTITLATPEAPRRGHLPLGEAAGTADRIEVTSRSVERGGAPAFPITGEIHYSRLPRERWDDVLAHAKAGGLTSVATYVLWQAHEPRAGDFRWDGNLDLRAFVQLAGEHGLDVVVRMGPWAHGEARHGGFPDWLLALPVTPRTDDPGYLDLVRRLYGEIVAQLRGLTHAEGGPIIAAQMDNELYDQPEHLATLRRLAEEAGLAVPLWTATGWGGAQVPDTLLPVYSAYVDGFWEDEQTDWPSFAPVHFHYSTVRDDLTVGADLREALDGVSVAEGAVTLKDDSAVPFATCELGGGMHVAYHRRPLVTERDVAALAHAKIGSGSVWQGYYMYSGGTQRIGAAGTQQESHATGYPNDVPTRTYDFHAPLGEHGQVRLHHHLLRRQHLWLHTDGAALAAMTSTVGGDDALRWAVRADASRGYVFATTYQPARRPLPAVDDVQFAVTLAGDTVTLPTAPVTLPAGVHVAWPVNLPLARHTLRSATAQVLTRLTLDDGDELVVLTATDGVPVELVVAGPAAVTGPATVTTHGGHTVVRLTADPSDTTIVDLDGTRLLILDEATANRAYVLDVLGRERLILADQPVTASAGHLVIHPTEPEAHLAILPAPADLEVDGGEIGLQGADATGWARVTVTSAAGRVPLATPGPLEADAPSPTRGGPMDRLSAPTDFSGAASVDVAIPAGAVAGADRALLRVEWTGDVGRALRAGEVVSDHFWHGRAWDIDVTDGEDVTLELLPWSDATGVWVDPSMRPVPDGVSVRSLAIHRIGRVTLTATEASR